MMESPFGPPKMRVRGVGGVSCLGANYVTRSASFLIGLTECDAVDCKLGIFE